MLDTTAQHVLILETLPMAAAIARRYRSWGDIEDSQSAAYLGLVKAATRFDPEAHPGVPFSAYARLWIRSSCTDQARAHDPAQPLIVDLLDSGRADVATLDDRELVDKALAVLSPREREVIDARYFGGPAARGCHTTVWRYRRSAIARMRRALA